MPQSHLLVLNLPPLLHFCVESLEQVQNFPTTTTSAKFSPVSNQVNGCGFESQLAGH